MLFASFHNLGPGGKCRPGRRPPCPPSHHVKAKPTPALRMLPIKRHVRKEYVLATWDVFVGLQALVLSGLSENNPKRVPIVLMMFLYQRGTLRQHHQHSWDSILTGAGGVKTQKTPSKKTLDMALCAG